MKEENKKYYIYLENLRKSGITNMFGAAPYLQEYFGITIQEARNILNEWMSNYDEICKKFY